MTIFGYDDNFFILRNKIYTKLGMPKKEMPKLQYVYCIGTFLLALAYYCGEIVLMAEYSNDLSQMLGFLQAFLTLTMGFYKFFNVVFRDKEIKVIMNLLQLDKFKYKSIKNFEPYKKFNEGIKIANNLNLVLVTVYFGVGFTAHLMAALEMHLSSYGTVNDTRTCVEIFMFSTYIPFKPTSYLECHFFFALVDCQLAIFSVWISAHDTTYITLLHCLKTQFYILGEAIQTIRERTLDKLGLPLDFEVFRDEDHLKLEKEMYKELRRCTKHLMLLIRVYNKLENVFCYVILGQSMVTLMVLASSLYASSLIPFGSPVFFSQMEYLVAVLCQFAFYCWFGNEIVLAGEFVQDSMFQCDWLSASIRFKKCLIINHERLKKCLFLTIGKFTTLKLSTLITVVRASFSYFSVFKNIEN
ncbi:uncharacterized protein LOC109596809 [Aethina tumida]|uniref:uncharacterized protein LOC109596809 n=1 Tax=Aethina tumida TaxID=116153 RepID=UPI0021494C7D|nr:uncharacterized protein LOC109596809 [Aethina tumida]